MVGIIRGNAIETDAAAADSYREVYREVVASWLALTVVCLVPVDINSTTARSCWLRVLVAPQFVRYCDTTVAGLINYSAVYQPSIHRPCCKATTAVWKVGRRETHPRSNCSFCSWLTSCSGGYCRLSICHGFLVGSNCHRQYSSAIKAMQSLHIVDTRVC